MDSPLGTQVYGKCSVSEKAWDLVRSMEERFGLRPTVVIYTCLISGLLRQKKSRPGSKRDNTMHARNESMCQTAMHTSETRPNTRTTPQNIRKHLEHSPR